MMSRPQPGCCRRRAAVADIDSIPSKGYTSRAERSAGFTKTRMCKFFLEGKCTRGKKCTFAHGEEEKHAQCQPLCMKLCKTLIATGRCKNENCKYAHSKEDIAAAKLQFGLMNNQDLNVGSAMATSGCAEQIVQPKRGNVNAQTNVRWFGFLCNMRWVCPLRSSHRAVVAPPGVLEPVTNSTAISYPAMQTASSEVPAVDQAETNSLSDPLEPAFQVVVKNTFIDVVETSPKSSSRSRSEPPQFMNREVERRPRSRSAIEDVSESPVDQQLQSVSLAEAIPTPAAVMAEPLKVQLATPRCAGLPMRGAQQSDQEGSIEGSLEDIKFCAKAANSFADEDNESSGSVLLLSDSAQRSPSGMCDVSTNHANVSSTKREEEILSFSGTWALPRLEVRNTFIEVCQSPPKPEALRTVRSAEGRLDQLAGEGEAIHQLLS